LVFEKRKRKTQKSRKCIGADQPVKRKEKKGCKNISNEQKEKKRKGGKEEREKRNKPNQMICRFYFAK